MMQNISGKVVVLTGAGGGIGEAIAQRLASAGARLVFLGGNHREKLERTRQALPAKCQVALVPGNLADGGALKEMTAQAVAAFGGVDILINNAGVAQNTPFDQISEEELDRIMNINFRAPFLLTQQFLPWLRRSSEATIVNITSVVSHAGYPQQSAYTASKHALLGWTKSLAAELYQEGIRVHAIAPGGVYTDMVKISRPDLKPDGMIMPEEIADIVEFLLTHRGNAVIDEVQVHRLNKQPFLV